MNRSTLIAKLKQDIAAGRIVTIAGTGVSVAASGNQEFEGFKVATWTGLLQHGVKHLRDIGAVSDTIANVLNQQVNCGETDIIIGAAETISKRIKSRSEGSFRGWLKDTIGQLKAKNREVVDALAAFPGVLATLNYDNILEEATGRRAVTWLKTDEVQEVLSCANTEAILHLHGWFREPESVVLGLSSYLAVKDHPHAKAVLNLFTIDRTLLFVGCGDTVLDPNFDQLIEWGKEALSDVSPRHYLLCRTGEVPEFQEKLNGAPWLQPLAYGEDYSDLVPFLRHLAPASSNSLVGRAPSRVRGNLDLTAYRQAMRKRYARLRLEELDPTTHDVRPVTLTGMFISQSARECVEFIPRVFELPKEVQRRLREQGEMEDGDPDSELLEQHRRAYLNRPPRPILEIIRDTAFQRLVVLGDPGSGKSTLLQYILLNWAENVSPDLPGEPLPLLIELREYARLRHERQVSDFLDYLHQGASVRWQLDRNQLDVWLKNNPTHILFDGLDEVFDPALRKEITTAIHRFADEYPPVRIIVTSRIVGFSYQAWRDEDFRHFLLQDLDEEQISDFLARWHRGAYEEASKAEVKRSLLAEAIRNSSAIRQLAGNPLLLTMMAILNRTQDLPRDRSGLYEQCARLLLHQWKVEAAFQPDPELARASLDYKDKRGLLLKVARTMQSTGRGLAGNLIEEDVLEETLANGLRGISGLRPERAARALIEQLRGRNFMLCDVGGRSYAFVHRTFLEYFCAIEILERFQTEQSINLAELKTQIFGHWADETWHEVLTLLAGLLAPKFIKEILTWLLDRPNSDNGHHVFLAARCVGEVRRRDELGDVDGQVLDRVKAMIYFDLQYYYELWEEEMTTAFEVHIHAVELVATIWRDAADTPSWLKNCAQSDENLMVAQAATRELARGWKDAPETLPWLKACAQSHQEWIMRTTAMQELARGWKDDPETLAILKTLARSDESWLRRAAVDELAKGWKDFPETLTILKTLAQSDGDRAVRQSAARELARGWRNDSETLPWLKAIAQSDNDDIVRKSAMQELSHGWKSDPGILPWLKARAQSDDDSDVRKAAVKELARGWKDDPTTLLWLQSHAQSDDNWAVRQSAVQELAHGWKGDPDTLTILKSRAQSDEDKHVRMSAIHELARCWKDDPDTLAILKIRLQSDRDNDVRRSALQELARGWKDDPETLIRLKAHIEFDGSWEVRQGAVHELTHGWKSAPETLAIIMARAKSDEDGDVRLSAVHELARNWREAPETLKILKASARSDEDQGVRQSALRELGRNWKEDPETLKILKASAQSDDDKHVRLSALRELARGTKLDREILTILKARAQSDEDKDVRLSAVHELARNWKHDPETLAILTAHAQSDEDKDVRLSAAHELARNWKDAPETPTILKASD